MTAGLRSAPGATGASLPRRIYGLGSVFGKTLRDSRRSTLLVGGLMGLVLVAVAGAITSQFATPESRQEIRALVEAVPPILQGLAGRPVNVESLGGYIQYKYGTFFPIVASMWSILALSATLATEARRGSLDLVAAAPLGRRRIAVQKLFGHLVPMAVAMVLVFVSIAFAGSRYAVLPGDGIGVAAAGGYALWLGVLSLAAGAVAFAVAPFLGRGAAMGIAGAATFGGFILNGYQFAAPGLAPFANLTWFGWTTNHLPLAGQFDWVPVGLTAAVTAGLFVVGIEAFARRDLGTTIRVPSPSLPGWLIGLRGPTGRTFGEAFNAAASWGIGIGLFGLLLAGSGRAFIDQLNEAPDFMRLLSSIFPDADIASVGGFLELLFVQFGLVLGGLAAATLVGRWASDETSGRLEFLLAAPVERFRWIVSGGLGLVLALAAIVGLVGAGIGLGAMAAGDDVVTPVIGGAVVGLYGFALVGIGVAVGGLLGAGFAAPAVVLVTLATWFVDIIAPVLNLPDWVRQLALTSHYGSPMLGQWDFGGVVASLVLGVGGVLLGAWGFARRDLRG